MAGYVQNPLVWGHRGLQLDENGNAIQGTSAADEDLDRYQAMGAPVYQSGPRIRQDRIAATRDIGMGSLGMLKARAEGASTPAQDLAGRQTLGAVDAVRSGAATARGGAAYRAAAQRGAVAQGARIQAQGVQDQAALAARERADAAGQYYAASTAQRGAELGLATEQAKLDAGQRTANEGRDQFYEGLGYNTQKARTDQALGRSAADEAASNAARAQTLQEQAQARQQANQIASGVVGGVTGGLDAYAQGQNTKPQPRPAGGGIIRDNPYDTSDMRAKEDVGYITSDAQAKRDAYLLGRAHEGEQRREGKEVPYAFGGKPREGEEIVDRDDARGRQMQSFERHTRSGKPRDVTASNGGIPTSDMQKTVGGWGLRPDGSVANVTSDDEMRASGRWPAVAAPPAAPPAPPPAQEPEQPVAGYVSQLAGRARAMLSDMTSKEDAHGADMAQANRAMAPFSYAYKPGHAEEAGQAPGERNVGPMAQNMAADPVASTAIVERPDGMLAIDKDKALKLTMGGLSSLQSEVDALKKRKTA